VFSCAAELVVDNLANNQLLLFKISLTNGDLILEKQCFNSCVQFLY
jgi:hypothetical protein